MRALDQPRRRYRRVWLAFIWLICVSGMFASAYAFHFAGNLAFGPGFFAFGALAFLPHAILTRTKHSPWGPTAFEPLQSSSSLFIIGIVLIGLTAEFSVNSLDLDLREHISIGAQFGLIALAITLVGVGLTGIRRPAVRVRISRVGVALFCITALGLGLRLWRLETAVHFFVDEMNFGKAVTQIERSRSVPLYAPFSAIAAFPWIYPYWQSWTVDLFGHNLTGLRVVSVVFGSATIPVLYFLARQIFQDKVLALLAAFVLAVFPPHIHFSRLGLNNIVDPLIGCLLFAFLARGLKEGRQTDFVLAGLCLGLTQYFYEGGRILYPVLALIWVECMVVAKRIKMPGPTAVRTGLMVIMGLAAAYPIYFVLLALDKPLLGRFSTAGVGGSYHRVLQGYNVEQTLEQHITRPIYLFLRDPELSQFYGGETPLLLFIVAPFFLIGVAGALWRWRMPGMTLVLFWWTATMAGNAFLADSAHAARYVVSFPAVALLIALGIRFVALKRSVLIVAIALGLAYVQVDYYFGLHLRDYNRQLRPFYDVQDAIFRSTDFPEDTEVCVITAIPPAEPFLYELADYLAPHISACIIAPEDVNASYIQSIADGPLAFFIEPDDDQTLSILQGVMTLDGPEMSPFDGVLEKSQLALYTTPSLRP